jgi:hypothetical protein
MGIIETKEQLVFSGAMLGRDEESDVKLCKAAAAGYW